MYLIFDESLREVADEVFERTATPKKRGTLSDDLENLDDTLVIITDLEEFKVSPNFRRRVLSMMSKGAIFFTETEKEKPLYEDEFAVDNAHFVTLLESDTEEDRITTALSTGRYAEGRAKFFAQNYPKIDFVGPTFADPIAVVVLGATRKEPTTDVRRTIAEALPEDFWYSVAYVSSYRKETLQPLLDYFPYSSVLTVDKKMTDRVESLGRAVHNVGIPDDDDKYGSKVRNTVETQE